MMVYKISLLPRCRRSVVVVVVIVVIVNLRSLLIARVWSSDSINLNKSAIVCHDNCLQMCEGNENNLHAVNAILLL